MSLSNPLPRGTRTSDPYACDGVATTFPVPFWFLDALDLLIRVEYPAGIYTYFTGGVGYTVDGVGAVAGGHVIMAEAPANGAILTVIGRRVPSRTTSVYQGGMVNGAALDLELDTIEATLQELRRDVNAALAFMSSGTLQITRRQALKALKANTTAGVNWLMAVQDAISPAENADDNIDFTAWVWPAGGQMWLRVQSILNQILPGGFTATQRKALEAQAAAIT